MNSPNSKGTKQKAQLIFTDSSNFKIAPVHKKYLSTKLLPTDNIYGIQIPENVLEKYFFYTVDSYDSGVGEITSKYKHQAVNDNSNFHYLC